MTKAILKAPTHSGKEVNRLGDMAKSDDEQTSRAE
jgi:hypothetical protein